MVVLGEDRELVSKLGFGAPRSSLFLRKNHPVWVEQNVTKIVNQLVTFKLIWF